MAYSTSVFLYTQRQIVVLLSGFSPRIYMPQYAKPLKLHKGVDNQLQFQFLNQEQKPQDITGKEIICRIISYTGNELLLQKALTLQLPLTGIASLYLNAADIENIDTQKAYYSLEIPAGQFDFPVYVDQNAGARGEIDIVNSILPNFVPSMPVSIPLGQPFPNTQPNVNFTGTYYTSVIDTSDNPILTIQMHLEEYSGNITVQGSTQIDADWYDISFDEFYEETTDTVGYTIRGFHPYVRVRYISTWGDVTKVLSR